MKLIIITSKDNENLNWDVQNCHIKKYYFENYKKNDFLNHEIDSQLNAIALAISKEDLVDAILLDFKIGNEYVFPLVHHIRLLECAVNSLPIILINNKIINIAEKEFSAINTYSTFDRPTNLLFCKDTEVFNKDEFNNFEIEVLIYQHNKNFNYLNYINELIIDTPRTTSRHQISNEWGSLKLALNAGYKKDEVEFSFPPTLYFKYLIKKFEVNILSENDRNQILQNTSLPSLLKRKKILLIDDNADSGWEKVLELIFKCDINSIRKLEDVFSIQDYLEYDLVFFDLYMPYSKQSPKKKDNSLKIIESLKKKYPQIPIIVFTASNKSWTLDEVLELGADGMYVKESPEYVSDYEYTKGNFKNFVQTVSKTLNKYGVLRPYWDGVQYILENIKIQEQSNTLFKERIEERLKMFYGLLKRGFEQTEFNEKQFHFSDNELAFMTLWSVLNEISEANYHKTQPNISISEASGNPLTIHPGGAPISYLKIPNSINHYKWEIVGQSEVFVEYDYSLNIDKNTGNPLIASSGKFYKLNYEQKSCFLFDNSQFRIVVSPLKTKVNYENTLYLQIAFLIERKVNLSTSINKSNFQQTLVRLNEVRNHLYLTHGSDISSGFYNQTEKAKRVYHTIKPNGDIKDLFELISFLLTGKENKVDIN